jgi:hypothetical protein
MSDVTLVPFSGPSRIRTKAPASGAAPSDTKPLICVRTELSGAAGERAHAAVKTTHPQATSVPARYEALGAFKRANDVAMRSAEWNNRASEYSRS